ncbi:MAG: TonB-dependent receptor plug domain-containing protein [Elusimicrobia bacterium]|nr:TonB-dependent receptor plug domain-containing protein [Elusimicrobiota bacterium]
MKIYLNMMVVFLVLALSGMKVLGVESFVSKEEFFFGEEKIAVATGALIKGVNIKNAPGIVTLITAEEIKMSGARDLIDVLRQVPGFNFGLDVEGAVSLGMRGIWGQEGKILLLIDGQEFNDLLYSSLEFGNHFSLAQIKQIEIIRGPGSAIYGGFAELGVINIVTKKAGDINGMETALSYGQLSETYARRNVDVMIGKRYGDWAVNGLFFAGQGNRSNKDYRDFAGNTYSLKDNSKLEPLQANISMAYKGLQGRLLIDKYHTTQRDLWGENLDASVKEIFDSYFSEVKYDWEMGKVTVTPRFNYKKQIPWSRPEPVYYKKIAERYTSNITMSYRPKDFITLVLGGEHYEDKAKVSPDTDEVNYFANGKPEVLYFNNAVYAQGVCQFPVVDFTVGARYEHHNQYGDSFVPRIALTKLLSQWNFKALYSQAFRSPGIENINLGEKVKPEKTKVVEFETGYQFAKNLQAAVNVFALEIKDPITYQTKEIIDPATGDSVLTEGYKNYGRTGSRGIETVLRYKDKAGGKFMTASWSYYQAHDNMIETYRVENNDKQLLAFPVHKIAMSGSYPFSSQLSLNPSITYLGKRYGYYTFAENGEPLLKRFKSTLLLNAFLLYQDMLLSHLDMGVGVYNILNQEFAYIQPYNGGHAPLPADSRELRVNASYHFAF